MRFPNHNRLFLILLVLISLHSKAQIIPPYFNDFENIATDTIGWSHSASTGIDDWEIGEPTGIIFDTPYSGNNIWCTDLDTTFAANSIRYLETPYFDLSSETEQYVLSFQNRVRQSGMDELRIKYKKGSAGTWMDFPTTLYEDEMPTGGGFINFQNTDDDLYVKTRYNTNVFDGPLMDSVKFRFNVDSDFVNPDDEGWAMDDFSLKVAEMNYTALSTDTIFDINANFTEFEIEYKILVNHDIDFELDYPECHTKFYFSDDSILDPGDTLVGFETPTIWGTFYTNHLTTLDFSLNLPDGLTEEYYYLFYVLDEDEANLESDETDNIGVIVLKLAPIMQTNYIENFDENDLDWNSTLAYGISSNWYKGEPYDFNIEEAHSLPKSWSHSWREMELSEYLETPYLDFSLTTDNSICFFAKMIDNPETYAEEWQFRLHPSKVGTEEITFPVYYPDEDILIEQNPRIPNQWDCYCFDISEHDDEISAKFRLYNDFSYLNHEGYSMTLDDFYIGSKNYDFSVEGRKTNRFTSAGLTTDTLKYYFFNSGLATSPETSINFYWSEDSLYDISDLFLGNQSISSLPDTSFVSYEWIYDKADTETEKFYIIYVIDEEDSHTEMREYNNIGSFEVHQLPVISLPYINDFESEINGWRNESILNDNNWEWTTPAGDHYSTAFSGEKAWITNDTGQVAHNSKMELYTPVFDLTELEKPVLDFNLWKQYVPSGSLNPIHGNIMYSTDGGYQWQPLNFESDTRKGMYTVMAYNYLWGNDYEQNTNAHRYLIDGRSPNFVHDNNYLGRDYWDTYRMVVDLDSIKNSEQVQFKYTFSNTTNATEGILLDDFKVVEAAHDLLLEHRRNLMVSSGDDYLKVMVSILNNANAVTNNFFTKYYLSSDTILDASDTLILSDLCYGLMPYKRYFSTQQISINIDNYGDYNYLLFDIDSEDNIVELDESNNLGIYNLNMDSLDNYFLDYAQDFNDTLIDGWTWYVQGDDGSGPRFRHRVIQGDPAVDVSNGHWFLDPMDLTGYYDNNWADYGTYYLEAPAFDFSQISFAQISFDLLCRGSSYYKNSGGNLQYSLDGGHSWDPLFANQDPDEPAANWYAPPPWEDGILSIGNQNGWNYVPELTETYCDISHIMGSAETRLRFKFRSEEVSSPYHPHGMWVDNFAIATDTLDFVMVPGPSELTGSLESPVISFNYQVKHRSTFYTYDQETVFFWSNDSILDEGDLNLGKIDHYVFPSNSTINLIATISRPDTLSQLEYYLFYVIDGEYTTNETHENNNTGRVKIVFESLSNIDELATLVNVINFPDYMQIDGLNNIELFAPIQLYNSRGQLIKQISSTNVESSIRIEKSDLSKGIYFLKIETNQGVKSYKIINY